MCSGTTEKTGVDAGVGVGGGEKRHLHTYNDEHKAMCRHSVHDKVYLFAKSRFA